MRPDDHHGEARVCSKKFQANLRPVKIITFDYRCQQVLKPTQGLFKVLRPPLMVSLSNHAAISLRLNTRWQTTIATWGVLTNTVIPAKAGIQRGYDERIRTVINDFGNWIPAFAGMTGWFVNCQPLHRVRRTIAKSLDTRSW